MKKEGSIGIYIHIPFCKTKCRYCNFVSFCTKSELIPEYIKSLIKEIEYYGKKVTNSVDTIYIGGGTPSVLYNGMIATIINAIKDNFDVLDNTEISIECNPNSVDHTKAEEWYGAGVNRVSVGLQTIKQGLLNKIGRSHTKEDFVNAITVLKSVGFKNINADIMIGLPGQKLSDVRNTLIILEKQNLTHISCYSLILEENTPLYQDIEEHRVTMLDEEKTINMYSYVVNYLSKIGFSRYEVSNFAMSGFECKHNVNCWNMHEYLGFGASAHSYFNNKRHYNYSEIEQYIDSINKSGIAVESEEQITDTEALEEYIMLSLRLKEGIDLTLLKTKYNYDLLTIKHDAVNKFLSLGLIDINNNRLFATDKGFYVLNQIILNLVD